MFLVFLQPLHCSILLCKTNPRLNHITSYNSYCHFILLLFHTKVSPLFVERNFVVFSQHFPNCYNGHDELQPLSLVWTINPHEIDHDKAARKNMFYRLKKECNDLCTATNKFMYSRYFCHICWAVLNVKLLRILVPLLFFVTYVRIIMLNQNRTN